MGITAPSKLGQWVIYCMYTDENNTMDTVSDFLTPGYKIVFAKTTATCIKLFPLIERMFYLWFIAVIELTQ